MSAKEKPIEIAKQKTEALLLDRDDGDASPIWFVASTEESDLPALEPWQRNWLNSEGWRAESGSVLLMPDDKGGIACVLLGTGGADWSTRTPLLAGDLPGKLPAGDYRFASELEQPELSAFAWLAGAYRFTRYKQNGEERLRRLVLPEGAEREAVVAQGTALYFGRDLINTPANDMGPVELEHAARELAERHGASIRVTEGEALLKDNFPMIHAVGRASDRAPRLIDVTWGSEKAPKVTLIGKGICFDTGGLDIKSASGMALMKKDMGGAASVLALAHLIMERKLRVRLRMLVPAAENSISSNAFRPGDVLPSRSGRTVEIGHTDAEGRLVLADAISLADEETPDYLVTIATLTGSARVALGPDLPPLYTDDDQIAEALIACGGKLGDPLWRMPLWSPYDRMLKSKIADMNHVGEGTYAGSVVAALFLKRFVRNAKRFIHLDIFGWVPRPQSGRPDGGDPQGIRALFSLFQNEFRA
jgi:leucyl aminopeptidase